MDKVEQIHENIYALLVQRHESDPGFRFTFRKSNRSNRLENGYWFYGNEHYVTVSFWSGIDWKNKTPNIVFTTIVESGESYLEVNMSDSDTKRRFVTDNLVTQLSLEEEGVRYRKRYTQWGADYMASLRAFLENDKPRIDAAIREESSDYFSRTGDAAIGFIQEEDFEEQLEKVSTYRSKFLGQLSRPAIGPARIPQKIAGFTVENFGPIQDVKIVDIPYATQWVFFTGENGTGKTSLLRALATAICHREIPDEESSPEGPFRVSLSLYSEGGELFNFSRIGSQGTDQEGVLLSGFAAYGASRLRTGPGFSLVPRNGIDANPIYASLFDYDAYLADLQVQLDSWRANGIPRPIYEKRKYFITEILTDIFANLHRIDFDEERDGRPVTYYVERDYEGGPFKKVSFEQLASGLKSLIGMIGDILVRMYAQQPEVDDPSQFTGLVLIDEIDLHLHPKLQKELVEQLTHTFPGIQFIATTHSPIPLLGAPRASRIFKVARNSNTGVMVERLDDKLILGDLLPNTILTSPIFGLDDIVPSSHDVNDIVRTEVNFADITFNDLVRKKIQDFLTDQKEQQLIDLFKSRAK